MQSGQKEEARKTAKYMAGKKGQRVEKYKEKYMKLYKWKRGLIIQHLSIQE